jgi:hypothetical protein
MGPRCAGDHGEKAEALVHQRGPEEEQKKKEGDVFSMWSLPETLKVFAWLAWLF